MEYIHSGRCVKKWLIIKDKSQADLARAIDTTDCQVVRYIKNENIKLHTAQNIANFLGISLAEFLGLTDD